MIHKQFKSLDEQIEILKYKGLVINNVDYAKNVLLRENYFFVSGYRHLFMKSSVDKVYKEGTRFEEVYSLFLFDRTLRNILFKNLLIIENNLKSISSYQLSKRYGYKEKDYLKEKNFDSNPEKKRQVNDLIKKMKKQIRSNSRENTATLHYVSNYGYIPLWILVKVLSFGIVSEMYSVLKVEDQKEIAGIYGIDYQNLLVYLPILSNYRNLCAHEDILYENKTKKEIDDTIFHKLLNIEKVDNVYKYGKNDIFALVIIMKELLQKEEFKSMMFEIENAISTLDYNLKTISIEVVLDRMGFPPNWKQISEIERSRDNE
ncbi:MAG: Abi family protein [Bacilli bacterium]|nr:Abi family protein [Bacilli bacterium]